MEGIWYVDARNQSSKSGPTIYVNPESEQLKIKPGGIVPGYRGSAGGECGVVGKTLLA